MPPAWFELLTLDTLAATFSPERVIGALALSVEYAAAPTLTDGATLTASTFGAVPAAVRRGVGRPGVITSRATFREHPDGTAKLQTGCTCDVYAAGCVHVLAMLVDLALHPGLRDAVLDGRRDVTALLDALPALRVTARDELHARALADRWLALATPVAAEAFELRVTPVDARPGLAGAAPGPYEHPTVELRLMSTGDRSLFDPREIATRPLPRLERRLFTLGEPLSRGRKGVSLSGTSATIALHLLRASGREVLLGEKGSEALSFRDEALRLRIARTTLARGEVSVTLEARAAGSALLEHAGASVDALEGRWYAEGVELAARDAVLFAGAFPMVWAPALRAFFPVDESVDPDLAWSLHCRPSAEVPQAHAATVLRGVQRALGGRRVALPRPEELGLAPRSEAKLVVRIEGRPLDVTVRVEAEYDFGTVPLGPDGPLARLPFEHDLRRDPEREREAVERVAAASLTWSAPVSAFVAKERDAADFWTRGIVTLREPTRAPLSILVAENLRRVIVRPPVRPRVRVSMNGQLLDAEFAFDAGELAADLQRLREVLRDKRRWVELDDGSVSEIQDTVAAFVEELDEVLPAKGQRPGRRARVELPAHQLGRVERWVDAGVGADLTPAVEAFRARLRALAVSPEAAVPAGLRATLRPYQNNGLAWLQFLDALGAGGVLADDMGLGKTLTTLALLLWRKERDGAAPTLVVAPTSVAGNWVREAARFTPDLSVLLYHGDAREKDAAALQRADIVVTTYTLLRRDLALLASVRFRYAVLDEAQNIKNAGAQAAQAARELDAERRLALSGTPVENHLGELWAIMDFANPAMLGTAREFSTRYEKPITADPASPAAQRLRGLVRPFILRRTKREVLTELPPKQEIDQLCAMTPAQRRMYDALAAAALADVEERIASVGIARCGLSILTALLRLRQAACDPRLVDGAQPAAASAKRAAFLELVEGIAREERRVLVFSQFTELLGLWRKDLDAMGIAYEYLDGGTRDRDGAVARFQSGTAPVFLISLKAGGTGLNLTAADTVIHCDPWWNPAAEAQATDRAHRMGQARAVTVYRLIAKGTLEERIVALKERKRALAEAVVAEDAGALRGLSEDDVKGLLGGAEAEEDFEGEPVG